MAKTGDTGSIALNISAGITKTASAGGLDLKQSASRNTRWTIVDGAGALGYNRVITKTGTANSTPAAAIDLSGTSTDDFGDTTDLAEVLAILIENTGTSVNLIVGGESADITVLASGFKQLVLPGDGTNHGTVLMMNPLAGGFPVTATTADKISVSTASSTTTYKITVFGRA